MGKNMIQNEVLDCIHARRSTRSFLDRQIEPEQLDALLGAAVWAPSGGNSQTWLFTAVQNKEKLLELNELVKEGFQRWVPDDDYPGKLGMKASSQKEGINFYYHAPTPSLHRTGRTMKMRWPTVRWLLKTFFCRRSRWVWAAAISTICTGCAAMPECVIFSSRSGSQKSTSSAPPPQSAISKRRPLPSRAGKGPSALSNRRTPDRRISGGKKTASGS